MNALYRLSDRAHARDALPCADRRSSEVTRLTCTPARRRETVLVIDDDPVCLMLAETAMQPAFEVWSVDSAIKAWTLLQCSPLPDIILLDAMMPQLDGYAFMRQLRASDLTHDIPVIFVTARDDAEAEAEALALGAVDYVTKPLHATVLHSRVRTHLDLKHARDQLRHENACLGVEVRRQAEAIAIAQDLSLHALASLAEMRDPETAGHMARTRDQVRILATRLQRNARYASILSPGTIEWIVLSAPLHDIGKVGLPDAVLRKPGPLTQEERAIVQTHARLGANALAQAECQVGQEVAFLGVAKEMALHHHENWDGSGYPDGLRGEAIPFSARLMAVADVFDALVSRRVYKPAMSCEAARGIMIEGRGRQFDPDVLDAFLGAFDDIVTVTQCSPQSEGH